MHTDRKVPVFIGVSVGKDSRAMAYRLCDYLDNRGHVRQRLLIHSDLGRAEWRQSLPVCESLAARLGVELVVVRGQAGDMMDRWLRLQTGDPRFEGPVDPSASRNGRAPGWKVRTDGWRGGRYDAGMCNRYVSTETGDMERYWHIGAHQPWRAAEVFPRTPDPFLRADRENQLGRELVIGQWGLVPWLARSPRLTYSTADLHPLMNRMQKTDPELGLDQQDKRMVVPIELGDVDTWVNGSQEDVSVRVRFAPAAVFDAGPVAP